MAQQTAFAAPRSEEMVRIIAGISGAGIAGVVEGVIVKMAPQMGAAKPVLTWGTLLGMPLIGGLGALFTRGIIGDACQGIASGGTAILGYTLPELLAPGTSRKVPDPTPNNNDIKRLPPGRDGAPQRAQSQIQVAVGAGWE